MRKSAHSLLLALVGFFLLSQTTDPSSATLFSVVPRGMVLLDAGSAVAESLDPGAVRLGPHDAQGYPVLGYWVSARDYTRWTATIPAAGRYRLIVESGNAPGTGGSRVRLTAGSANIEWICPVTGVWDDILAFSPPGVLTLPAGTVSFRLEALELFAGAVMNLRGILLVPESANLDEAGRWLAERARRRTQAWNALQEAAGLRTAGDLVGALARSESACAADPGWGEAWRFCARDRDAAGRSAAARAAFDRAITLFPADPWIVAEAANLDARLGLYADACARARRAIERFDANGLPFPAWLPYNAGVWAGSYLSPPDPASACYFFRLVIDRAQPDPQLVDTSRFMIVGSLRALGDMQAYAAARDAYLATGINAYSRGLLCYSEASRLEVSEEGTSTFNPWYRRAADAFLAAAAEREGGNVDAAGEAARIRYLASISLHSLGDRAAAYRQAELAARLSPANAGYRDHWLDRLSDYADERFASGDFAAAASLFDAGRAATPPENENRIERFRFLSELCRAEQNRLPRQPLSVHRIVALVIPSSDFNGHRGGREDVLLSDLEVSERFVTRFWEAASGGRLSVSFAHQELNGAVVRTLRSVGPASESLATSFMVDLDTLGIDRPALERGLAGRYDSVLYYWNSVRESVAATGGGYQIEGTGLRGLITMAVGMARGDGDGILLHEVWHVFQNLADLGPLHVWLPENMAAGRAWLPSWTGTTEWSWMRAVLQARVPNSLAWE